VHKGKINFLSNTCTTEHTELSSLNIQASNIIRSNFKYKT